MCLTNNLNSMDSTGSIKFMDELKTEGRILFLDALISRKEHGSVTIQVYQQKMHTDQYLHFNSLHPLNQKLGVIRILYDKCNNIVTDLADTVKEITHVNQALSKYEFPEWTFKKVKQQFDQKPLRRTNQ